MEFLGHEQDIVMFFKGKRENSSILGEEFSKDGFSCISSLVTNPDDFSVRGSF